MESESRKSYDVISFLLDQEHLSVYLDEEASSVKSFRANSAIDPTFPQSRYNLRCPVYFSNDKIPSDITSYSFEIVIPAEYLGDSQSSHIEIVQTDKRTKGSDIVEQVANKVSLQDKKSEYILKAKGKKEFLRSDDLVWHSSYVRENMRKKLQTTLTLIHHSAVFSSKPGEHLKWYNLYEKLAREEEKRKILRKNDFLPFALDSKEPWDYEFIPFQKLSLPFRVKIIGLDNIDGFSLSRQRMSTMVSVSIKTFLFYGSRVITQTVSSTRTKTIKLNNLSVFWMENIGFKDGYVAYNTLPRATKIAFLVYFRKAEKSEVVAWGVRNLIDEYGRLSTGRKTLNLWPSGGSFDEEFVFTASASENRSKSKDVMRLAVQFECFILPVLAPKVLKYQQDFEGDEKSACDRIEIPNPKRLEEIYNQCFYDNLTPSDLNLVWNDRRNITKYFSKLPLFLQSVNWENPKEVSIARKLLFGWKQPRNKLNFIALLNHHYHDIVVRQYATKALEQLTDAELSRYLMQLIQIVKLEPYHHSAMSNFLIRRSLENPLQVGQLFFWMIKSEIYHAQHAERFYLILEEYVYKAVDHRKQLLKQSLILNKLAETAKTVMEFEKEKQNKFHTILEDLNRDLFQKLEGGSFLMIHDPRIECTDLIVDRCRYMSSKKKPLWLVFNDESDKEAKQDLIFKAGDDIRQDALTLQLFNLFDQLWLAEGLDLRLIPYNVTPMGFELGTIEVVKNAVTISNIHRRFGGGAVGALKVNTIDDFLRAENVTEKEYEDACINFVSSSAGYCVATYALGIGDRHSSNIMLTKNGNLFHIDFGHFLGNFKTKMGVLRERSPFVFTPEMAYVMGGKNYNSHYLFNKFKDLCNKAFLVLRKHYRIFVSLLQLMIPAGLPELRCNKDIEYFTNMLMLDKSDAEAQKVLQRIIQETIATTSRQLDNFIHNIKHN